MRNAGLGPNSDVFSLELISSKIVHEVFGRDEAAILVVLLQDNLLKLLVHNAHDFFELESHRFVGKRANLRVELLIKFLDHARGPIFDLVIDKLDLFLYLMSLFSLPAKLTALDVEVVKLGSEGRLGPLCGLVVLRLLNLELVKLVTLFFVLPAQVVDLRFVIRDRFQKLIVSFLAFQEFLDDLLHVRVACLGPNFLEGLLVLCVGLHFAVHLVLQETGVKLLSQKVFLHLQLIRIFFVVGRVLSDALLLLHTADSAF